LPGGFGIMDMQNLDEIENIVVELEDNRKVECTVVSVFPVERFNGMFIALNPTEETGFGSIDEIHLFSLIPVSENNYELGIIDESDFGFVLDAFNRLMEA
jgi:hypothetical protein